MTNRQEDDILKNKFSTFEVNPSAASFDAFGAKLAAAQRKKKRRALVFYLFGSGMAAILLVLLFSPVSAPVSQKYAAGAQARRAPETKTQTPSTMEASGSSTPSTKRELFKHARKVQAPEANTPLTQTLPKPLQTETAQQNNPMQPLASLPNAAVPAITINPPQDGGITVPGNPSPTMETVSGETLPVYFLSSSLSSSVLPAEEGEQVTRYSNANSAEKELLKLKAQHFKPAYYVGASYLILQHHYITTANNPNYNTGYTDFSQFYINNYRANQKKALNGIPALVAGVVLKRKFDFSGSFGYMKLVSNEKLIYPPADSASPTTTPPSLSNIPLFTPSNSQTGNSGDSLTLQNKLVYVFAGANLSTHIRFRSFTLKPGCGLQLHLLQNSAYVFVDSNGYNYQRKGKQLLNAQPLALNLKLGISRTLFRGASFQLSPVYVLSLQSVFDKNYFVSRKFRGVGLESAFIYKFGK